MLLQQISFFLSLYLSLVISHYLILRFFNFYIIVRTQCSFDARSRQGTKYVFFRWQLKCDYRVGCQTETNTVAAYLCRDVVNIRYISLNRVFTKVFGLNDV